MMRTRILVADSLTVFRAAVRTVLGREKDFDVVEAADLDGVLAAVDGGFLDVVLVDLDLPPSGGLEAVRAVTARCGTRTDVIVWSLEPRREAVFAALRAGACGFLDKELSPEELVRSLRGVSRGEAPLSRELAALAIRALHEFEAGRSAVDRSHVLSGREREVLDHVARGERNRQIANALAISEFTVKRHVQNILRKLELGSRRDAAAFYAAAVAQEEALL